MARIPVLFRRWRDSGDIIAVFPTLPSSCNDPHEVTTYMHIGQHGGGHASVIASRTRSAKPAEFKDLARELRKIGYRMKVVKRVSPRLRAELKRNFQKSCG